MGKVSPVPIMKDLGTGGATGFWDLSRKRVCMFALAAVIAKCLCFVHF